MHEKYSVIEQSSRSKKLKLSSATEHRTLFRHIKKKKERRKRNLEKTNMQLCAHMPHRTLNFQVHTHIVESIFINNTTFANKIFHQYLDKE
jgi:hypothetical protein